MDDSNVDDDSDIYNLERILYQREVNGKPMFLTKWEGYGDAECTWEPSEHFSEDILAEWEQQRDSGDFLPPEQVAEVEERMEAFQQREEQKQLQETRGRASSQNPGRQAKSEPAAPRSPIKRLRVSPPTPNRHSSKRTHSSRSATVNEEAPEHSEVAVQGTAEQTSLQKPKIANAGSAQVTPKQVNAKPFPGAKGTTETTATPFLHALTQGNAILSPALTGQQGGENVNAIQASKKNKTNAIPTPRSQQTKRDAVNTLPIGIQSEGTHAVPIAKIPGKNKARQRFRNLKEQNMFSKFARWERPPDISKLDLRSPDEWAMLGSIQPVPKVQDVAQRDEARHSPLFVPGDHEMEQPKVENLPTQKENLHSSKKNLLSELPPPALGAPPGSPNASEVPEKAAVNGGASETPRENIFTRKSVPIIRAKSRDSIPSNAFAESRPPSLQPRSNCVIVPPAPEHDDVVVHSRPVNISTFQPRVADVSFTHGSSKEAMAPAPGGLPSRTTYQGKTGNLDVIIRAGNHEIGTVTLVELPLWLIGKLRGAREPGALLLTIHFKDKWAMNAQEFSDFSRKLHPKNIGNFSIQAHDNTLGATEDLSKYLEEYDLGAIWEYPQPLDSLILILYSSRASGWRSIREGTVSTLETRLQFAVRNKLPGIFLENDPGRADYIPFGTGEQNTDLPGRQAESSQPEHRLVMGDRARARVQSPVELSESAPTPTTTIAKESADSARSDVKSPDELSASAPTATTITAKERSGSAETTVPTSQLAPSQDSMDYMTPKPYRVGPLSFSAKFDDLFCGWDKTQRKPRVMICFGKTNQAEAEAVRQWLYKYLSPRKVFMDTEEDDWEEFQDNLSNRTGVVLFHEQQRAYCDLRDFCKILRLASVFCHEISSSFHQMKDSNLDRRSPMTRLFPRGTVLCITESTLVRHPEEAIWAIHWFEKKSINKQRFWKLFLLPDMSSWILRRAKDSHGVTQQKYIDMSLALNRLQSRSLEASRSNGGRSDDPDEFVQTRPWNQSSEYILSPSGLAGFGDWDRADLGEEAVTARDKSFLGYFVAWAARNATLYRRFIVQDKTHSNETEKHSWHILFREPRQFVEEEKRQQDREDEKEREDERRRARTGSSSYLAS
ncbi:uncharacterized protein Z519_06835 [Cladophialophora bantiana CBS 173.52]|uniref:Unplaced genomic scaffold supercont1.9, whole genome shotgun sequence n=1 Tax=Cladophialophora bantiana (strain ATCC 10958 / CBS 173.52 / CDC B-1940 / NIH 8579) TaxID=1442370 RepID=A0A0D2ESZ7_CLAB1|nr:uncharacterized protein Z519_06835 [Cladophialophora bantiana CBS 173.52]KIW92986.1 hypothetical protein Z519_06835 [Cladophialophora bantiana CBS 173.52]